MNVSVNWLRELAPGLDESPEELAYRLSMVAANVETTASVGLGLEGIVAARVLGVSPHPNADRLRLCEVDPGTGSTFEVVCGAPVLVEGALYPFAAVETTLPGGLTLERRKIRGVESQGMLCSEYELEIGRDRAGIMRLPDDLDPGVELAEALGLPDAILSLDLNPNRGDLACHVGVARELAPGGDSSVGLRDPGARWSPEWRDGETEASGAGVRVRIEAPERCPRYLGAVVRGVKVGPSPAWLAGRLLAVGARPINNVVDATNYILFELNQPIHAFDLAGLEGDEVRVRPAAEGETLRTLDGEERGLGPDVTVIADRDRPLALAGVMGGEESEVAEATTDLFIECAVFDPGHVRATVRRLGLPTDASYRFEREVDRLGVEKALVRCVEIILATAGGKAEKEAIRVGGPAPEPRAVPLRPSRVRQLLGIQPDVAELESLLTPIGFASLGIADGETGEEMRFQVPGWRNDVLGEIDLVEEVARRFGYDNFPDEDRRFRASRVPDDPAWERAGRVRTLLTGRGLLEARSSAFVPEERSGARSEVGVLHPLSAEEGFLRIGIVPVLLDRVAHNFARGNRDVRLFEIGTVFRLAREVAGARGAADGREGRPDGTERYQEEMRVGLLLTGRRHPRHWSTAGEDCDFWDLEGLVGELAEQLLDGSAEVGGVDADLLGSFAGGWLTEQRMRILHDGQIVGVAGRVDPASVEGPPWVGEIFAAEFRLSAVARRRHGRYELISPYPAVRRDLAITVPLGVKAGAIEERIRDVGSEILESVRLFDVYDGPGVEPDRRSLAWAFRFRSRERTLTDEEVEGTMQSITRGLKEAFDARVRTT